MKDKSCSKIDDCPKIDILRDKDMLDSQFAEAVREVCAKCEDFTTEKAKEDRLLKDGEIRKLDFRAYLLAHRKTKRASNESNKRGDCFFGDERYREYWEKIFRAEYGRQVAQAQLTKDLEWEAKTAEVVRGEIIGWLKKNGVEVEVGSIGLDMGDLILPRDKWQALKGKPK